MVSRNTNNPKLRGNWKKVLLFSITLLRLMAVPALASSIPTAGAVCDRARSPISTDHEFRNVRGHRPRLQQAEQWR
jgi:hypothetical protein